MPELDDALELRIVLYDDLVLLATRYPELSRLLPEAKHRQLSKDAKTNRTAAWKAFGYLGSLAGGLPLNDDLKTLLTMWCARQRRHIKPGWLKHRRRGRPGAWEKESVICVAYARKLGEAPQQKKESIIAELAQEYGLKRRRVFDIIRNVDPDLLLRSIRDPDPFGWSSDQSPF